MMLDQMCLVLVKVEQSLMMFMEVGTKYDDVGDGWNKSR